MIPYSLFCLRIATAAMAQILVHGKPVYVSIAQKALSHNVAKVVQPSLSMILIIV
jgi:hypothetical protein